MFLKNNGENYAPYKIIERLSSPTKVLTTKVMNKTDYEEKALKHLSMGSFIKVDSENLQMFKNKVRSEESELLKEIKPFIGVSLWLISYPKSNITS